MIYQMVGRLKDGRRCLLLSEDCESKDDARHFFSHYFNAKDPNGASVEVASFDRRTLKLWTRELR